MEHPINYFLMYQGLVMDVSLAKKIEIKYMKHP